MSLSNADGVKCPRCGGKVTYYSETELSNGIKLTRYVVRCKTCGFRDVLQEVELRRSDEGVFVSVHKPLKTARVGGRVSMHR